MNTEIYPNQSCRAYFGDSTQLTYLRSRFYSGNTGRFLTRDTWMGDYNRPLSLNRWIYVEGNPVNLTDPSGLCAKGKCGPDYTDWFINQATDHYQYSIRIRALRWKMKQDAYYLYWTKMFDCGPLMPIPLIPPFLSQVATERPFKEIVTQWNFPHTNIAIGSTPLVNPAAVNSVIDALGVLEYALYGLAVDYSNVEYPQAPQCNTPGCSTFGSKGRQAITICDKCMDVSDLGNLMFGLGGAARGYTLSFSYGSATIFNGLNDRNVMTMLGVDPRGAIAGWAIGNMRAFESRSRFCSIINSSSFLGWNENSSGLNAQCAPCNVVPPVIPNTNRASSLITVSKLNISTIDWLKTLLPESLK